MSSKIEKNKAVTKKTVSKNKCKAPGCVCTKKTASKRKRVIAPAPVAQPAEPSVWQRVLAFLKLEKLISNQ
jgi:hypothetical protein